MRQRRTGGTFLERYLTPVEGAVLQEAIDVAVILNALRALRIVPRIWLDRYQYARRPDG